MLVLSLTTEMAGPRLDGGGEKTLSSSAGSGGVSGAG